ncbi:response regulator transcription factor [Devosia sp. BK]|jgi:DNA-binding response OmpR family regulator|uniref:response regulator n=1 Tax=unclassified Devosia TaxID=196773 RepID=UPI000713AFA3|nr:MULTISPECIES: response regulator transcription factor [unclassified Devosia]KQN74858.1 two-component system response regulator [Devosia sp. Leaf64]KQT42823.1 two-component system response regulator [Devosia sp. Leaf420]MDV3253344.1 response regulator transcription factor [Devosia sp. BK]
MRILLVEDEVDLAKALISALERHDILVDHVTTLEMALEAVESGVHSIAVLDRKLPDGDSLTIIPRIRKIQTGLPIIVLSALGAPEQRIEGLETGADDYLAKPFVVDELVARIRALMRRPAMIADMAVTVGQLTFNLGDGSAVAAGEPLTLTRREVLALEVLVKRAGRTVARSILEEAVYGFDDEIASNTLDAHISRLRRKIAPGRVEIHSIRGIGYLLKATA